MSIGITIKNILLGIESGCVFDSHYIVNQLVRNYSDEYLRFMSQYKDGARPTLTGHQMIGHAIKRFNGNIVERLPYESWSETIHGTYRPCALWQRK